MSIFGRFLYLGILGTIANVVGIGSGLNSLFGGNGPGGGGPTGIYTPTGRPQADQTWQQAMQQLWQAIQGQNKTVTPGINQGYAATQPGGQFGDLPNVFQAFGNALLNSGAQSQENQGLLSSAGNQVYQTALDPQNALRNMLQQQVTDASRAGTSARGIGMGGEAAGIENQDVSNFLMNWQNQQLSRQLAGLQGMSGAMGQAANQGSEAGKDLAGAGSFYTQGANFPFQAAGAYEGATQPLNQNMLSLFGPLSSYLGLGNQSAGQAFGQQQIGLGNIAQGLNNLGSIFNTPQYPAPISDQSTNAPGNSSGYGP